MSNDFTALENWAGALLEKLSPAERRKLATTIARDLRRSQQKRITEQKNPDGSSYASRKPRQNLRGKKGSVRAMFANLRTNKYLQASSDTTSATVQFVARVQSVARVHQFGLTDKVDRKAGAASPIAKYPARRLLGITDDDRNHIQDLLLQHLS